MKGSAKEGKIDAIWNDDGNIRLLFTDILIVVVEVVM